MCLQFFLLFSLLVGNKERRLQHSFPSLCEFAYGVYRDAIYLLILVLRTANLALKWHINYQKIMTQLHRIYKNVNI